MRRFGCYGLSAGVFRFWLWHVVIVGLQGLDVAFCFWIGGFRWTLWVVVCAGLCFSLGWL